MFVVYGAPVDVATAAVLAYRVFQLGLPAILGALSLLRIRALLADESRRERGGGRLRGGARSRPLVEVTDHAGHGIDHLAHSVGASPNSGNSVELNVVTSATLPSTIRRTSILNATNSVLPWARR